MKKLFMSIFTVFLVISLFPINNTAYAEKVTYKWGNINFKSSYIGKIVVQKNTTLYKWDNKTHKLRKFNTIKKGSEYGVYTERDNKKYGKIYGLGNSKYVKKTTSVKFMKPSKHMKETVGKERIWLRNPDLKPITNSKGKYTTELKHLQEAIIISTKKDEILDEWVYITIKVGQKYYVIECDPYLKSNVYYKKNPFKTFKYSNSIWNLIKKEKIQLGMTKNQVRLSWGDPTDINSYGGSWGIMEQWIYGDVLNGGAVYLYFDNGKLESWQDF